MKPFAMLLAGALMAGVAPQAVAQADKAQGRPAIPEALKDPKAQFSYAVGLNVGASLKRDGVAIDPAILARGVADAIAGGKPLLTREQIAAVLTQVKADVQARHDQQAVQAAEANKTEGSAFMKANAAKPGVVSLPSGLHYEILTAGTGLKPKVGDTVFCNYRGTVISGIEFDSSYGRGEPASFAVGGVIKGWTEALQLMPVGSKWRLFVPPSLAYGEAGAGDQIGPNSTLIFEVELISIQPKG